ncbi:MAG TPA: hypothetical protein VND97_05205, partial [Beijerinckiaceae bacterium]|nr:hypothetical protein [Beijerinckiaceae bacterium]
MIRFLLRVVGVALLAGAFASAVIDGTRSIAANALLLTPFGDACAYLFPKSFPHWRSFVEQHVGAWAWDPTLIRFFQ